MGKTRQEQTLPTMQDTSGSVKTVDRMSSPVTAPMQERTKLGERLQAKRDAETARNFPGGIPQRMNTLPHKPDSYKGKSGKAKGEDGETLAPINDAQAAKAQAPKMFVGSNGSIVGTAGTKEGDGQGKKNDKGAEQKVPKLDEVKQEAKAKDTDAKALPGDKEKDVATPKAEKSAQKPAQKGTSQVKAANEPAKKSALDTKQKAKAQVPKKSETKEAPVEGTKGNRHNAAAKGKAETDPNSPVAKVAAKGAKGAKGKKGKKKGAEEEEKLAADLDKDPKKAALVAGADGEGDGDGKGDAEKGKDGEKKEAGGAEGIVIPPVVRGNFGEGAEPKLLQVNAEALKEFVPEAVVNRNADGSAVVLAGNMSASSDEDLKGPDTKPKKQDVPAADATAIFAANRLQLNALIDDFEMQARALATELEGIKAGIAGQILAGAEAAKAAIADAAAAEKARLAEGYAAQKGAIRAGGKRLKADTNARAKALKETVKQDADSARDIVTTQFDTSDAALVAMELDMGQKSTEAFMQAPLDLVAVAEAKGILASQAAQQKAAVFDAYPIPEQSGVEEFFNGEAYEKNRHRARVDAAEQVGTAYVDQFAQKAQEQGQLVSGEGLIQFQDHIVESIMVNREAIKARKESALSEIKAAEDNATATITTNAAETCKTIEAAVKSGIDTLYAQEKKANEGIDMMAEAKSKAIDETAAANVQNLELQTQSAVDAITAQINQTITDVTASNNPQADMISGQLQQVLASLRSGHADATLLATSGTDATIAGVTQVAADTAKEIAETVGVSLDGAQKVAGGQVAGLEAQFKAFDKGNTEIQKNASKGMKDSGDSGEYDIKSQFDLVKSDLDDGYGKLVGKFAENTQGFSDNLDTELGKQNDEMNTKAQEAYDAVNPAWVDFLLSAIDIIVMILVTAVICVALASGVGILGLLLIGAAAGAVGGMIKYGARVALTSEEASWKGLAHAAVDGAIDGAKIAASMIPGWGPLVQIGVGALAGGLKYGNDVLLGDKKFSWQGLGINVFMGGLDGAFSIIGNKAGGGMGKLAEKYMVKAIGGKAVGIIGKEAIGKFADDATQAFTDTLNGGLQNMLQMWADGKGLDFKNFTDKLTFKELATNFATNKISGWGTDKATGGIHAITGIKPVDSFKPGMAGYDPKVHGDGAKTPDVKHSDNQKPDSKTPEVKKPDTKTPDVKKPDTKTPEVKKPDTKTPEVKKPDTKTPEVKKPDTKTPEVKKPDTKTPEVKKPDTKTPEVKKPDTKTPEVKKPDTKTPEVKKPDTKVPDTKVPDVKHPDTKVPDTKVPDVKHPDTKVPDVKHPDTKVPDTKVPDTKVPDVKKQDGDDAKPIPEDKTKKKESAKVDEHVEVAPTKERLAEMENMIMGHGVEKHVDPDGTVRYVDKTGAEIGRLENGTLSYSFKGFGGPIVMNPDRPTTIIGKFDDVTHPGGGTKWVHDLPEGSFSRQGGKEGGLNMLDVSQAKFDALLVEAKGDTKKRDELFWERHNLPLLKDAFASGHDVRLLSDPTHPDTRTGAYKHELETIEGPNGLAAQHGYVYDPDTKTYKPGPKNEGADVHGPDSKKPTDKDVDSKKPVDKDADSKKPKDKDADSKKPKDKDADSKKPKDKDADSKKPVDKDAGSKKPKDPKKDDDAGGGGMKGKDVYSHAKEGERISDMKPHEVDSHIMKAVGGEGKLPNGAEIKPVKGEPGQFLMTIPDPANPGKSKSVEITIKTDFDPAKAKSSHGGDQGAAMNTIKVGKNGEVSVTIDLSGKHGKADLQKMVGHEMHEVADILGQVDKLKSQNAADGKKTTKKDVEGLIAKQQEAGVFKQGGSTNPKDLTAHDRAAIKEMHAVMKEAAAIKDPVAKADALARVERLADAMGLKSGGDPSKVNEHVAMIEAATGKKLTGEEIARLQGAPQPPDGYMWVRSGDGEIRIENKARNSGPVLEYKHGDKDPFQKSITARPPIENFAVETTQEFTLGSTTSKPKEDGKSKSKEGDATPSTQTIEVEHSSLSKSERKRLEKQRRKRLEQQELKKRAEAKNDLDAKSVAHGKMVKASENLGDFGAIAAMKKVLPNAEKLPSDLPGDGKHGQFDQVYQDGDKIYIVEAKGASSEKGSRKDLKGEQSQQGTPEYIASVIDNMGQKIAEAKNSPEFATNKKLQDQIAALETTHDALVIAQLTGNIVSLQASQRVDPNGGLVPSVEIMKFEPTSIKKTP